MKNILVIGAGLSGATIANMMANEGHRVKVIDVRNHVAGNAYDYVNEHGIRVHKYGPHLFHTNNSDVFKFLSNFTDWVEYKHKVKAKLKDKTYVTMPPNRETKEIVGEENILDVLFRPYTRKMWGMELDEISPTVINRIPIRDDDNEFYFPDDEYQYLPVAGYTAMVNNMLDHKNIEVFLDHPYERKMENFYDHTFNSMPIDVFHDCKFGPLPYRSIKFKTFSTASDGFVNPTTTVNYTKENTPLTRITEWKHLPNSDQRSDVSTFTTEEPCDYKDNNMERYYPVKDVNGENRDLYKKYKDLTPDNMTFIGRCGLYTYLDMDQAVNSSIQTVKKFLA